ncbi:MAG: peptidylprolyl isomerase [Planctomycetota bacterium]|nr:peptidylprolyl isomerase [Planctomycetota bacterium]
MKQTNKETAKNPVVVIETSMGAIKAELWADKAPKTVANFLRYTDENYYDGLIFHRVIDGFMIQGGGFTPDMRQKPTHEPIKNEASAEAPNARGTLAMARTGEVHSATAQFFINLVDNNFLNHKDETPRGFGYCAFGKVVEGMDVVERIAKVGTGNAGPHQNVPIQPVIIKSIRRSE